MPLTLFLLFSQVEAIKSGVQPDLTMVVGPPGTGKTDTAVKFMQVLFILILSFAAAGYPLLD